jgi:hypothetical protein
MMRNPKGHLNGHEIDTYGAQLVDWVEGFTTCGLENTGPSQPAFAGHGSFTRTRLDVKKTTSSSVQGTVQCANMVMGPYIEVERTITACQDRKAFVVRDVLSAGTISSGRPYKGDSPYMLLYHPNFPLHDGDRLFTKARTAVARDLISNCGMESFMHISGVGQGVAAAPPSQPDGENYSRVKKENFERCYVMDLVPDRAGDVFAAIIGKNSDQGAYIKYNARQFKKPMAFQLWRNPRGGCCGLEIGTTFMGRAYAMEHGLMRVLKNGEKHTYEIEAGFLKGKKEVADFLKRTGLSVAAPELIKAEANNPDQGEFFHRELYKYH